MRPLDDKSYCGELFAYKYGFFLSVVAMFGFVAPNIWLYFLGCAFAFWVSPKIIDKTAYENLSIAEIINELAANSGKDFKAMRKFNKRRFLKWLKWYLMLVAPAYIFALPLEFLSSPSLNGIVIWWNFAWIVFFLYGYKIEIEIFNLECYEKELIRYKQINAMQNALFPLLLLVPKKIDRSLLFLGLFVMYGLFCYGISAEPIIKMHKDIMEHALVWIGVLFLSLLASSSFWALKIGLYRMKTLLIIKSIKNT